MEANKKNLPDIFNGTRVLKIPFFQRSYVWEEEQWARLLSDIESVCETQSPYFVGALILKQEPTITDESCGDLRVVIDGQQRLTALSVLCKVLCLKKNEMEPFNRRFRLDDNSIALQHNDNDREVYEKIMNLKQIEKIDSKNRVAKTYKYFCDNLDTARVDFMSICKFLNFVAIDLNPQEDEQQIFDTINSLGVRLSAAELLKNYFFRQSGDREDYEKYWKGVFEKDETAKSYWDLDFTTSRMRQSMIDPFFFAYLQIKIQEKDNISTEHKAKFKRRDRLFDSYKCFVENYLRGDKFTILEDIKGTKENEGYAEIFRGAINKEMLDDFVPQSGIERINVVIFALNITTVIPYVLFVERNLADPKEKNKIYDCVEAYVVCRLVAGKDSRHYDSLFNDRLVSKRFLSAETLRTYLVGGGDGSDVMPTYDEILRGFHTRAIRNTSAKAILYLIESKRREEGIHSTRLLSLNEYSLEHMMPKQWEQHWPSVAVPELRDRKLLTLGNLAIITKKLNSGISNNSWAKKRVEMKKYSDGLETLCGALDKEEWDEAAIDARAEKLAEYLADMYGISRPSTSEKA